VLLYNVYNNKSVSLYINQAILTTDHNHIRDAPPVYALSFAWGTSARGARQPRGFLDFVDVSPVISARQPRENFDNNKCREKRQYGRL
jgi:hypothetical protein